MIFESLVLIGVSTLLVLIVGIVLYRRLPKKLKVQKFDKRWHELQNYCKDKATWPQAIQAADRLLDEALKKRKFSGGSMGERLVSAHKLFTDHDSIWQAHNLYKKLSTDSSVRLREADVKKALVAFRQALRDLGALPGAKDK